MLLAHQLKCAQMAERPAANGYRNPDGQRNFPAGIKRRQACPKGKRAQIQLVICRIFTFGLFICHCFLPDQLAAICVQETGNNIQKRGLANAGTPLYEQDLSALKGKTS